MIDQALPNGQATVQSASPAQVKIKTFREYPMFIGFFYWWLSYAPRRIFIVSQKIISYLYSYFSISILSKTIFNTWKKDDIDTTNMALDDIIRVWSMNMISRMVGASVRMITISIGISSICLTFLAAAIFFIGFILLPIIAFYLIVNGLMRLV